MKQILVFVILLLTLALATQGQNTEWTWSASLEEGADYTWQVETFTLDGESVESAFDEDLPIVEGSEIIIEITGDLNSVNLANAEYPDLSPYLTLTIDETKVSTPELYTVTLFLYPVEVNEETKSRRNIENAFEFFGGASISTDGDVTIIEESTEDYEMSFRYETETGVLQEWKETTSGSELLITLNSSFLSFLPSPPLWIGLLPLLSISLIRSRS